MIPPVRFSLERLKQNIMVKWSMRRLRYLFKDMETLDSATTNSSLAKEEYRLNQSAAIV